jgi:hypothetical protein
MMRRGCNCKRKDDRSRPSYLHDRTTMLKSKVWWDKNLKDKSYEDLTFDDKQNMKIVYSDIFPKNKITDSEEIYNNMNKHLENYKI